MTDTIQYSNSKELFQPIGLKEWRGFTVTRTLKEGETLQEAATKLIAEMEMLHGLYGGNIRVDYSAIPGHPMYAEPAEKLSPEQQRQKAIDGHIKTISECTTLKNVEIFRTLVERANDEKLTEAYVSKLATFTLSGN